MFWVTLWHDSWFCTYLKIKNMIFTAIITFKACMYLEIHDRIRDFRYPGTSTIAHTMHQPVPPSRSIHWSHRSICLIVWFWKNSSSSNTISVISTRCDVALDNTRLKRSIKVRVPLFTFCILLLLQTLGNSILMNENRIWSNTSQPNTPRDIKSWRERG